MGSTNCDTPHASLLLEQWVHLKVVQERLGHGTISTTICYLESRKRLCEI